MENGNVWGYQITRKTITLLTPDGREKIYCSLADVLATYWYILEKDGIPPIRPSLIKHYIETDFKSNAVQVYHLTSDSYDYNGKRINDFQANIK